MMDYDPIKDEKKKFTAKQWKKILFDNTDIFLQDGLNPEIAKESHTFNWRMSAFHRFMGF